MTDDQNLEKDLSGDDYKSSSSDNESCNKGQDKHDFDL